MEIPKRKKKLPFKNSEPDAPQESRGLGDDIAAAIERVTGGRVKPCHGCHSRKKTLNKMFPKTTQKRTEED